MNDRTDYGAIVASPTLAVGADTQVRLYLCRMDRAFRVSIYVGGRLVGVAKRFLNGWEWPAI